MRKIYKYIWFLLFLFLASITLHEEYDRVDYGVFENETCEFLYALCLILSVAIFWTWIRFYKLNKKKIILATIVLVCLFWVCIFYIKINRYNKENVPVFLEAGVEGFRLNFRIDSTYRIQDYGEFSGESYYGKFTSKSDTFILDMNYNNSWLASNTLVIKSDTNHNLSGLNKSLFQLDTKNKIIGASFPLDLDKRQNH